MQNEELFEELAAIQHEIWASWQKYLHDKLHYNPYTRNFNLDGDLYERWERQVNTPYSDLSEKEKDSDREQVRKFWQLINSALPTTANKE